MHRQEHRLIAERDSGDKSWASKRGSAEAQCKWKNPREFLVGESRQIGRVDYFMWANSLPFSSVWNSKWRFQLFYITTLLSHLIHLAHQTLDMMETSRSPRSRTSFMSLPPEVQNLILDYVRHPSTSRRPWVLLDGLSSSSNCQIFRVCLDPLGI